MSKFLKQKNKKNKAFTLVETLVAISIFTMSILGLMSVLASGISNTNYAKQKMAATYLAQEGIEYVRNMRDNYVLYNTDGSQIGWFDFTDAVVGQNYPITDPDFSGFSRENTASVVNPNEVKISSRVSWTQGSGNYNIVFSENLFNWIE